MAHDEVRAGAFHHHAGAVAVVELPPASLVRVGARVWVRVSGRFCSIEYRKV